MTDKAEPAGQSYEIAKSRTANYAELSDPRNVSLTNMKIWPYREVTWNDRYLSGLFRYGLALTTYPGYMMMFDERYGPSGKPTTAPRPTKDEPDLWPEETWIIFR